MATLILDTTTNKIEKIINKKYEILNYDNPILRKTMPVFDFSLEDPIDLASKLKAAMNPKIAFGLAAPQIGIETRAFIMRSETEYFYVFNPEILWKSSEMIKEKEACLSDRYLVAQVNRPKKIEVLFYTEKGEKVQMFLEDIAARIFLHEYDHLNGILFTDHVKPLALKFARNKQNKVLKKLK